MIRRLAPFVLALALVGPANPAAADDALAPVLFALRKAQAELQMPPLSEVITRRIDGGAVAVCGLVTLDGSRFSKQRFVALVDAAAIGYRGAPTVLLDDGRSVSFPLLWTRHCETAS